MTPPNLINPYMYGAAAGVPAWEFEDSQVLGSDGKIMEVHFTSAINFSDVQSFAIYISSSLNQSGSYQDANLRIGTGGSVISTGSYEAYGIVNANNGASYVNSSYGETSFRVETSNLGGTWITLMYVTQNPITEKPEMVMTTASDN